jgi:purine-cytosine permease-like protein
MDFNPVSLLLFILVLVPGYIFIHIRDYYLVKGEKSQFEKTVQGIIASTIIWVVFYF